MSFDETMNILKTTVPWCSPLEQQAVQERQLGLVKQQQWVGQASEKLRPAQTEPGGMRGCGDCCMFHSNLLHNILVYSNMFIRFNSALHL